MSQKWYLVSIMILALIALNALIAVLMFTSVKTKRSK